MPDEETTAYGVPLSQLRGGTGRRKTQSLFLEMNYAKEKDDPAPYTLKENDHEGKISMRRIYMEVEDPTEYMFALAALGSWEHWLILKEAPFFKPYLARWREELALKMRSDAIMLVREDAVNNAVSARWLAEKGWEKPDKQQRGRPSKAELAREKKEREKILNSLEEDASRVFGNNDN